MTPKHLIFLILLCNSIQMQAQFKKQYEILHLLDSAGLILKSEKSQFLAELKRKEDWVQKHKEQMYYESEIEDQPHYPLQILQQLKMYSTPGTRSVLIFRPAFIEIKESQRQVVREGQYTFLKKIESINLVSKETAEKIRKDIETLTIRSNYELVARAYSLTEIEYFLTINKLDKFLKDLLKRKLINDEKYDELVNESKQGKLSLYREVIESIDKMVVIDLNGHRESNQNEVFENIYRKTATCFSALSFDSIAFTFIKNEESSEKDFLVTDAKVSIFKGGSVYTYKSFYDAEYVNKSPDNISVVPEQYYQVFNKMLADQSSPYRLHQVMLDKNVFGILPLTKEQFDGLQWSYSGMNNGYIQVSYETFSNGLTQRKIMNVLEQYDSIGLFSHLTKTEIDLAKALVYESEINYYSDILSCFKNLVFEIDLEYGVNEGMYKWLTSELSKYSKDVFKPVDIIDTYNYKKRKEFDFGFSLNQTKYQVRLFQEDDWLDTRFFELIEKAIAESKADGRFYYVYPLDGLRVIFLTDKQHEYLKNNKLLELSETATNE